MNPLFEAEEQDEVELVSKRLVQFFLILSVGFSIILINKAIKEAKKLKMFFEIGAINLGISLCVFYNYWGSEGFEILPIKYGTCILFLMTAYVSSLTLEDKESGFKIYGYIAGALAMETSMCAFISPSSEDVKEFIQSNLVLNYAGAFIILLLIVLKKAEGLSIVNKIYLFQFVGLALYQTLVHLVFLFIINPDRKEFQYNNYTMLMVGALFPISALIYFKEFESTELEAPAVPNKEHSSDHIALEEITDD